MATEVRDRNTEEKQREKFLNRLADEVEAFWDASEFARWYVLNERDEILESVEDKLRENNYPREATSKTVDWELSIVDSKPPEFWAEQIARMDSGLESRYETIGNRAILNLFESGKQVDFEVRRKNSQYLEIEIHLIQTKEEWIEHFVPLSILIERLEEHWEQDRIDIANELAMNHKEYETFNELWNERLVEEGFPRDVEPEDLGHTIEVRSKIGFDKWAGDMYDRSTNESRHNFANGDAEQYYLQFPEYLDILIEFTEEPEEFILENPKYNTVD